ncbi:RluA family pseudouridine synthase [bacterium]|nr:RluA family pseudouridine synthase [bacterium]MBU1993924.1 RluA family pseudouridine synthase [bacterium]
MPFVLKKMFAHKKQKAFLYLIQELGYTQKEAQRLIAKGRLKVNGEVMSRTAGEIEGEFEFIYFEPLTKGLIPHAVYNEFVVFDKPSGLLIHPQNRNTPYSLIDELKKQFGRDANITHRIDQETSGLVLCARNKKSERDIKIMFQERDMKKKYLAMVHGEFKDSLCVEAPLLRAEDESAIVRMIVKVHSEGKASKTDFKPLKYFPHANMTLVECSPLTGRQHQIRVHLFHVKHPIVGDPIYGQSEENIIKFLDRELDSNERVKNSGARRLLLHANELEFELYNHIYTIKSDVDFEKVCFENIHL